MSRSSVSSDEKDGFILGCLLIMSVIHNEIKNEILETKKYIFQFPKVQSILVQCQKIQNSKIKTFQNDKKFDRIQAKRRYIKWTYIGKLNSAHEISNNNNDK